MVAESLAIVALSILLFGAVSRRLESTSITPPMFFLAAGYLVSRQGLGLLDLELSGEFVHTVAELALILVLFTDASRIDLKYLRRAESLPLRLLLVGLPLTILAGTAAGIWLLPELRWIEAALLASILAPTDAALGQAVVSNPLVPMRIRQTLNVESGLNDGIALPVVLVLAAFAGATPNERGAGEWLQFAALAVTLGPAVGVGVGWAGARGLQRAIHAGWINLPFQRLSSLGLAFLAFAGAELVGGNGFMAAFAAGMTLGNLGRDVCSSLHEFGETEGQLLTLLVFLIFGAVLIPTAQPDFTSDAFLYAIASLTLVRMLPVALALWGSGLRAATVTFLGWFGPRGLASILFLLLVVEQGRLESAPLIQGVVVLTVLFSTLLHGATAYPAARSYGAYVAHRSPEGEMREAPDLPVRVRHSRTGRAEAQSSAP